jgi:hypothetical protein
MADVAAAVDLDGVDPPESLLVQAERHVTGHGFR